MYWLADDFSQPGTDADLWQTAGHGAGVTGAEQNGRLEFSVGSAAASDSTTTGFDQRYGTQCLLTGDFDATVDYQLLDWPTKNGMRLGFGLARAQPNELFDIERHGAPADGGVEGYTASGGGFAQTSDVSGAFRLKRTGPWLSMYYRHRDRWVSLGAVRAPGAGQLVLMFAGSDSQFGRQPASSALDRFAAAADTVRCPGSSLPPRKARA
jgi:hypothetical protein